MSKSKSGRGRVTRVNANSSPYYTYQPELPLGPSKNPFNPVSLTAVEDRRTFHPRGPTRPAAMFTTPNHRLRVRPNPALRNLHAVSPSVAFQAPEHVLVCVRRQRRREVIHALGHAGAVGQKRPRRNHFSSISCRR